jgi:hypothetical protein
LPSIKTQNITEKEWRGAGEEEDPQWDSLLALFKRSALPKYQLRDIFRFFSFVLTMLPFSPSSSAAHLSSSSADVFAVFLRQ